MTEKNIEKKTSICLLTSGDYNAEIDFERLIR